MATDLADPLGYGRATEIPPRRGEPDIHEGHRIARRGARCGLP